ncbi:hypothetical protein AURDEDRAFT_182635 [Auricularia subglabra TFB-10046 SS5]|nr:hypothetical protein AURDEDRAFT_182635 [Auricularia subglabra TFB-10046 SS5]
MLGDSDSESSTSSNAKEREELSKLKDKYGSDVDEDDLGSDDSESSTEDEDGEELTPQVDAAILRTLARIRKKDPAIYESSKNVFQEEQAKTASSKPLTKSKSKSKDKDKPLTIKQHALNAVLEGEGSRSPSPALPTHVEEQRALRDETIRAFADAAAAEDDDFLVPREKTQDELAREEEDYRAFLEREVGEDIAGLVEVETEDQWRARQPDDDDDDAAVSKKKKKKRKEKGKEKVAGRDPDEDQKFLLDYILNRGWIDKSAKRVPTYNESQPDADSSASDSGSEQHDGQEEGEDDEVFEEAAEHFEEDYMYRFQEPGAATINAHPRKIPTLVRREDTRRKEARDRRKARKEEERLQKREEVKRLKALKVKELRRKLERIGREGGAALEHEALAALDLDAEWDPEKHDAQMKDIYTGAEGDAEGEGEEDTEKPQWDDDIDIGDIVSNAEPSSSKKKKQKKKKRKRDEDDDGAGEDVQMDADDVAWGELYGEEEWDGTEEMRKRKLDEYMRSLDSMEFNDIVGGLPTRFKYTSVGADDFGLSPGRTSDIFISVGDGKEDSVGRNHLTVTGYLERKIVPASAVHSDLESDNDEDARWRMTVTPFDEIHALMWKPDGEESSAVHSDLESDNDEDARWRMTVTPFDEIHALMWKPDGEECARYESLITEPLRVRVPAVFPRTTPAGAAPAASFRIEAILSISVAEHYNAPHMNPLTERHTVMVGGEGRPAAATEIAWEFNERDRSRYHRRTYSARILVGIVGAVQPTSLTQDAPVYCLDDGGRRAQSPPRGTPLPRLEPLYVCLSYHPRAS